MLSSLSQPSPRLAHRVPIEDPDDFEPPDLPVDPDDGAVPPLIPEDPEHDRMIDPEA